MANSEIKEQTDATNGKHFNWQLTVSILVSLIFLYLAVRGVDFNQVWRAIQSMQPITASLAVVVAILTLMAKAGRWQSIYAPRRHLSFQRAFSILMIGLWANAFLPLRVGEILRAFLLGEVEKESKTFALGTIFLEKLADLASLALALIVLFTQLVIPKWVWESWVSSMMVIVGLIILVFILVVFNQPILKLMNIILSRMKPQWRDRILSIVKEGMKSLQLLKDPRQVLTITLWSIIIWFLSGYNFVLIFRAFSLNLSFWVALFILIVLQLGVAIPSSPGKIGVFHYLVIVGLSVFYVPKDISLTVGVVSHLMIYAPIAILGVFYLWHENLAWRTINQVASRLDWNSTK